MKRSDWIETAIVIGISIAALGLAGVSAWRFAGLDAVTADLRMRMRTRITDHGGSRDTSEILLIAIDPRAEAAYRARYGTGPWLLRTPFFDQLAFLRRCLRPSVVAYDIIFKGTEGDVSPTTSAQSRERLDALASAIGELARGAVDILPDHLLDVINRLEVTQGNLLFAYHLAAVMASGKFPIVLGCHLRGGISDAQDAAVPVWERRMLEPSATNGLPAVAYLEDLAIPADAIRFADEKAHARYAFARNAGLPGGDLLDYCYLGAMNVARDDDGVVRRVPLVLGFAYEAPGTGERVERFIPSFALLTVLCHWGITRFPMPPGTLQVEFGRRIVVRTPAREVEIPIDEAGRLYLNWTAKFDDFAAVSFADVAPPRAALTAEALRLAAEPVAALANGRIAVLGVTVTGHDVGATPTEPNIPLVYAQMTAMNNILNARFLRPMEGMRQALLLVALAAAFTLFCLRYRSGGVAVGAGAMAVAYLGAAYAGVHADRVVLPVVGPVVYLSLTAFGVLTYRLFRERIARRHVRRMFSRMVSEKVLDYLETNPESFSLSGHLTHATVFFSDVAGFTSTSEHLPPKRVTGLLNAYLTPVTDCILEHEGYVDKYVGDGVMAVWGAPFPDAEHAVRACRCALAQQAIMVGLNDAIEREYGIRLVVRMGLNSGVVTAGNMGSERKFQYTVIGDVVNVAARLEPANKEFGTSILVGGATRAAIGAAFEVREVGRILAVGKADVVEVYELLALRGQLDAIRRGIVTRYGEALSQFYARQWDACIATLERLLGEQSDGPSRFLRSLAMQYRQAPPADDWRGEYIRSLKK
jgi:adenylate cyclase